LYLFIVIFFHFSIFIFLFMFFFLSFCPGNPNVRDGLSKKDTALHMAAVEGHMDCLRLLLQYKGDATLLNAEGKTCVQVASPEHRENIAQLSK
jgi:hypothetical protein